MFELQKANFDMKCCCFRCSITKESFVKSLFARHQFIYATDLRFVSRCPKWRRSFRPKKPEMFQYAEASIVFGVILSKRCQTMNEAQPTQTWSNKYGIQLMALFQENQIVSYSQNNCGGVIYDMWTVKRSFFNPKEPKLLSLNLHLTCKWCVVLCNRWSFIIFGWRNSSFIWIWIYNSISTLSMHVKHT